MSERQATLEGTAEWDAEDWFIWRHDTSRTLSTHGDVLNKLVDLLEQEGGGGPLHWETMTPQRRALVMEQLSVFLDFLDRVYLRHMVEFSFFKPCWWQHPEVVWQLTALWAAFGVAYSRKARPSNAQADWHERYLWPMLERMRRSSMKDCNSTQHQPQQQAALRHSAGLPVLLERWRNDEDIALGAVVELDPERGQPDSMFPLTAAVDEQPNNIAGGVAAGSGNTTTDS